MLRRYSFNFLYYARFTYGVNLPDHISIDCELQIRKWSV
jgi:hypothetical protein